MVNIMGDVSIIARRLEGGKHVQYGWSGNGGYFSNVGARLLSWYDDPEKVEYLFGLGQMRLIGKPGSENGGEPWVYTHVPDGMPHWLGQTERDKEIRCGAVVHYIKYWQSASNYSIFRLVHRFRPVLPDSSALDSNNIRNDVQEHVKCRQCRCEDALL